MKSKWLIILPISLFLMSCSSNKNTIKIFLTSQKEVNVKKIKDDYSSFNIEASYASTDSYYYPFLYKSCREQGYQIYVLRDEEYLPSYVEDIYQPLDDDIQNELNKECEYYQINGVAYGIKLNSGYLINNYLSFEEEHDYYLSITDTSSLVIDFLKVIL